MPVDQEVGREAGCGGRLADPDEVGLAGGDVPPVHLVAQLVVGAYRRPVQLGGAGAARSGGERRRRRGQVGPVRSLAGPGRLDETRPVEARVGVGDRVVDVVDVVGEEQPAGAGQLRVQVDVVDQVAGGGLRGPVQVVRAGERAGRGIGRVGHQIAAEHQVVLLGDQHVPTADPLYAVGGADAAEQPGRGAVVGGPAVAGPELPPAGQVVADHPGQVGELRPAGRLGAVHVGVVAVAEQLGAPGDPGVERQRADPGGGERGQREAGQCGADQGVVQRADAGAPVAVDQHLEGRAGDGGVADPGELAGCRRGHQVARVLGGAAVHRLGELVAPLHDGRVVDEGRGAGPGTLGVHRAEEGVGEEPERPAVRQPYRGRPVGAVPTAGGVAVVGEGGGQPGGGRPTVRQGPVRRGGGYGGEQAEHPGDEQPARRPADTGHLLADIGHLPARVDQRHQKPPSTGHLSAGCHDPRRGR